MVVAHLELTGDGGVGGNSRWQIGRAADAVGAAHNMGASSPTNGYGLG